ncbi:hypothetical protein OG226_50865 [Streptomyces sp. NBC_01261]|uniref:hypothetical protein n=1 Tax=Streptomyces sp. NBC_01261 TaxID=2903802 RepID=UPI002E377781|nr:hypothetical protein [Streptomyces sp. NBC_01261]
MPEVEATVAFDAVRGLVQGEGDVDDPVGERQDPHVVGQQLELGQGLARDGARLQRGRLRGLLLRLGRAILLGRGWAFRAVPRLSGVVGTARE